MIYVVVVAILFMAVKLLLWRPGEAALRTDDGTIVNILTTIQGLLDIVLPALISVFLYLHLTGGALYVDSAEAISGIIISAAISIFNIILAITVGITIRTKR
jgi:hypothetical protein